MKKYSLIVIGIIVVAVVAFFAFSGTKKVENHDIILPVKRGKFTIDINTSGELEAKNSVKIKGPARLRDFRINQLTINNIIDEGTIVKKGDWIADLDRSEFNTRLMDKQLEVEKAQSVFVQTQLDTALQLRQARDELVNLQYAVEEAKLVLEQSQFEPPATVKQNEYNLEKAKRNYEQAKENYTIKLQQNIAKMQEVETDRRKKLRELFAMESAASEFTILAPEPGMVVYTKGWDQKPIKAGSQISMWDPTVATLPDMTTMISKTYINEVDVRKVKAGQKVELGLDAFPDKKLTGTVTSVANVGEQRPNSDAKVFQAIIEIDGTDNTLRPSMTTSNKIIVEEIDSALFVPLESLHSKDDSITYVYKKSGLKTIKQEVELGSSSENAAIVLSGLVENDKVFLSIPKGLENDPIALLPGLNGKRNIQKVEPENTAVVEREITLPDGRKIKVPLNAGNPDRVREGRVRSDGQNARTGRNNTVRTDSARVIPN
ncbi:MAG TPA: HlyD family efflux transporter periplasmic adaptor subunit [Cyclobacteriaceae bacterium]|nr:HlyD family efflux transporter periplasmic adaptor subunit [Cyclobacteriaceae bacterium]